MPYPPLLAYMHYVKILPVMFEITSIVKSIAIKQTTLVQWSFANLPQIFSATEDSVVSECFQQFFQSLFCGLKSALKQCTLL